MQHIEPFLLRAQADEGVALGKFDSLRRKPKETRLALVGNFAPRKCGIATFTTDLFEQLRIHHPEIRSDVYALDKPEEGLTYENIAGTIVQDDADSYAIAARLINERAPDAIWLQHEYGIFGGQDGEMVCDFVDKLAAPLILTCHTVLTDPSPRQEAILKHLIERSSRIMVMSRHSRNILAERYGAPHELIAVIEHGAPDRPFGRQDQFKQTFGMDGRTVLMTFGLLGPGKGLERVIEALPTIVENHPEVVYRIVGATHPNLVARDGEAYRDSLVALARELGVSDHIVWDNRFLETAELLDQLEACDIYVTPYGNMQQSTSGTLSYAVALGKAVVSTPYVHAKELLSDGAGYLVEPGSSKAIADAVTNLLADPKRLEAMQLRAYRKGRETIWPQFAAASADLIGAAANHQPSGDALNVPILATPGLSALRGMSDSTGMLQHAIGVVPDRRHGYCLDDNARALMLVNVASGLDRQERTERSQTYASFIQHAWNPDQGRFRNFMNFERTWCEDEGSEDSNGRALWTLGQTVERAPDADIRQWASDLYCTVLPHLAEMGSPRAIAFAMLGACAYLRRHPDHGASRELLESGVVLLRSILAKSRRPDWTWFEAVLGYDNPRLPQALIEAASVLGDADALADGIDTLDWIDEQQTSAKGYFRPIGSDSFGMEHDYLPFDQQPLEVSASIDAHRAAYLATGEKRALDAAKKAWSWFFGANDRGVAPATLSTGSCRDGINPRGLNKNTGAESILAFQLSHYSVLEMVKHQQSAETGEYLEVTRN